MPRANTATPASFGAAAGANALGTTYATAMGTEKCIVDVSVRVSVKDISASGDATGNFNFVLDGLAEEPEVGDIWRVDTKSFHAYSLEDLMGKISNGAGNIDAINSMIEQDPDHKITSADMLANNGGEEILVTLGGYTWTPTYLSYDNEGNVILTLWMNDSSELNGKAYDTSKTFGSTGTSTWNSGFSASGDVTNIPYPPNMYGTSYMSAVVLNNGGGYATSEGATELTTATQNADSAFALFTMADGGLRDFIVTPEHVSWQESGQNAKALISNLSYNLPNENWGDLTKVPDTDFYSAVYNYAEKTGNNAWNNDWLWLPSLSETGADNTSNGIWATSTEQRKNTTYSWLRSGNGNRVSGAYPLTSSGGDWDLYNVSSNHAVRPALHLNLTKVANSL